MIALTGNINEAFTNGWAMLFGSIYQAQLHIKVTNKLTCRS